jgi:hypothetical protein
VKFRIHEYKNSYFGPKFGINLFYPLLFAVFSLYSTVKLLCTTTTVILNLWALVTGRGSSHCSRAVL